MRIVHRVSISSSPEIRRQLARLGIVVAERGLATFTIAEEDPAWPGVRAWIVRTRAVDGAGTEFSPEEIDAARWLKLDAWLHGYPQPDDGHFGYLAATYDLSDFCAPCGIGRVQHAPFQMKGEPRWGRRGMLQLNWVFDEYFVKPEIWRTFFEPHGIRCRPVLGARRQELRSVVQLVIDEHVSVRTDELSPETCSRCKRNKYAPVTRGAFPALRALPHQPIAKTDEFFGSGARAYGAVVIRQDLARALTPVVRGASLYPVQT